jgi:hypothetical protein
MAGANICVSPAFSQDGSFVSLFGTTARISCSNRPTRNVLRQWKWGSLRYCP